MMLFLDVRVESGATVTMLYEYLSACGITIPTWLASMMVYAVATETLDLSRNCAMPDLQAYLGLLSRANMKILGQIHSIPSSLQSMEESWFAASLLAP